MRKIGNLLLYVYYAFRFQPDLLIFALRRRLESHC